MKKAIVLASLCLTAIMAPLSAHVYIEKAMEDLKCLKDLPDESPFLFSYTKCLCLIDQIQESQDAFEKKALQAQLKTEVLISVDLLEFIPIAINNKIKKAEKKLTKHKAEKEAKESALKEKESEIDGVRFNTAEQELSIEIRALNWKIEDDIEDIKEYQENNEIIIPKLNETIQMFQSFLIHT